MATLDTKELKDSPQLVKPPIDDKIPQKRYEWGKDRGTVEQTKDSVRAGMNQPPPAYPPTLTEMRRQPAEQGFSSGLEYGLRTSDSLRGSPRPDDQNTPFQTGDTALPRRSGEEGYQKARQLAEATSDSIRGGFWSRDSGSPKGQSDIKATAEGIGSYAKGAGQEMLEKAKSAPAEIQDRSRKTYEDLKDRAAGYERDLRSFAERQSQVRATTGPQNEQVEGNVEALSEKAKGAAGEVTDRIGDAANKIKEAVGGETGPKNLTNESFQKAREAATEVGTAVADKARSLEESARSAPSSALERVENAVSSAEDAAAHVAGAVSAKVGEVRADWRKQQEEQLSSDTTRPVEERISHAERASEERSEQAKKEQEKSDHVEWLSETRPVELAREARDKVAEVTGINKARKVIGEKSHEFADEVREAKHTYGIALGRAKDAAVGRAHAAKEYIEDTGEWMKKGIDIAEGKIEHIFGIHIPRRTEGAEPQHAAYDKWSDHSATTSARDAAKDQGEYYGNVIKEGAERFGAKTTSDPTEKANYLQRAGSAQENQEAALNARDQNVANMKQQSQSMFGRLKSGLSRFLGFGSSTSRPDE